MAFIPDEAIDDSCDLTPSAFRLYCLLCRRRDHSDRVSRLRQQRAMEILKIKKSQYFDARNLLINEKWIQPIYDGEYQLLKGDFSPVDSEKSEYLSEKSDNLVRKIGQNTPKNRTKYSEKSESPLKEYPASLSSTINPAHTSNTKRNVCAGNIGSKFSLAECFRYVQICVSQGEKITSPRGLATKLYQTGEADIFIEGILNPQNEKKSKLEESLEILKEIQREGFSIFDYRKFHSEDEWVWLMKNLSKEPN